MTPLDLNTELVYADGSVTNCIPLYPLKEKKTTRQAKPISIALLIVTALLFWVFILLWVVLNLYLYDFMYCTVRRLATLTILYSTVYHLLYIVTLFWLFLSCITCFCELFLVVLSYFCDVVSALIVPSCVFVTPPPLVFSCSIWLYCGCTHDQIILGTTWEPMRNVYCTRK